MVVDCDYDDDDDYVDDGVVDENDVDVNVLDDAVDKRQTVAMKGVELYFLAAVAVDMD